VCLGNLKRLGTSTAVYTNENRDLFPPFRLKKHPAGPDGEEYVNELGRKKPRWQWFVGAEVGPVIDPRPFNTPFGDGDIGVGGESGREMTNKYFHCPSLRGPFEFDIRNGAYGYNYQYLGNSRTDTDPDRYDRFPVAVHRLRAASKTVLCADSRGAGRNHGKHSYSLDPPRLARENNATHFGPGASDVADGLDPAQYAYSPVEMRHRGKGAVAFVDAHAETLRLDGLGYEVDATGAAVPTDPDGERGGGGSNALWNRLGADPLSGASRGK
jgi:prepilin-type processing-associated H-X9-DG protein